MAVPSLLRGHQIFVKLDHGAAFVGTAAAAETMGHLGLAAFTAGADFGGDKGVMGTAHMSL
jgi:hypothetical protein